MKIGRNEPCVCGSGKKYKKCCLKSNDINSHHRIETTENFKEINEFMTQEFQNKIKQSEIWNELVAKFGEEKAEELIQEFKLEAH